MPQAPELSRRSRIALGCTLLMLSLSTSTLIHLQPQELSAPAWLAYSAASTFFVAGLLLLAQAAHAGRVRDWLAVSLLLAMGLPAGWVAFGGGKRQCEAALPFLESELLCRGAFGIGALLGFGVLILSIRYALTRKHGG